MNIIVNSWPSAGGTTTSILTAHLLNFEFLDVSDMLKFIVGRIYGRNDNEAMLFFEQNFGADWDRIWDEYIIWKLKKTNRLVLSGRITGFFIEDNDNLLEVMIVADAQVRMARAGNKKDYIAIQDNATRQRWFTRYNVDFFNSQQIEFNYDLIIDNSFMSPGEELFLILDHLADRPDTSKMNFSKLNEDVHKYIRTYKEKGVDFFIKDLLKRKDIISPEMILQEWRQNFPELIAKLPKQLATVL